MSIYDFGEFGDEELLKLRYHLNKIDEVGVPLGENKMKEALQTELEKRNIEDEDHKRYLVSHIEEYFGNDTSLHIGINGKEPNLDPRKANTPEERNQMWIVLAIKGDSVLGCSTDYGYRSKKEALKTVDDHLEVFD